MTIPHMHNCPHCGDGWCLTCVGQLYAEKEKIEKLLVDVGICPKCEKEIVHDIDEPFANCGCPGTIEWTSKLPLLSRLRHEVQTFANNMQDLLATKE